MTPWEWVRCLVGCVLLGFMIGTLNPPFWSLPLVALPAGVVLGALDTVLFPRR